MSKGRGAALTVLEGEVLDELRRCPRLTARELIEHLTAKDLDVRRALLRLEYVGHVLREKSSNPAHHDRWCVAPPGPRIGEEGRMCSECGQPFTAIRASNGRWPKTCGPFCQAVALDRFIGALQARRDALMAEVAGRTKQ